MVTLNLQLTPQQAEWLADCLRVTLEADDDLPQEFSDLEAEVRKQLLAQDLS